MNENRTPRGAASLAAFASLALLLLLGLATPAEAANTIHVSATPNTPTANGTALRNAVNGITGNAWGNRFVVKLESGVYDLGTTPLLMKPWVDIEGEGRGVTLVMGTSTATLPTSGIIHGADSAELRSLTVQATGTSYSIAVYTTAATSLRDVYLNSAAASSCWGLRSLGGHVAVEEVNVYVNCSSHNSGISLLGGGGLLRRVVIRAFGSSSSLTSNIGVWLEGDSLPHTFQDVVIDAGDANRPGTGLHVENVDSQSRWFEIVDSRFHSAGGIGIYSGQALSLNVRHSNVVASDVGIKFDAGSYIQVHSSQIDGTTNTVFAPAVFWARIALSQLDGGPVYANGAKCAGVYDEGFNFFASTCP